MFKILLMPQASGLSMYLKYSNSPNGGNLCTHSRTAGSQKNHRLYAIIATAAMDLEIM
jgi:hypothetical protein